VVTTGDAVTDVPVVTFKPRAGDQEYVFELPAAVRPTEVPLQILEKLTVMFGNKLTVTVETALLEQVPGFPVTVYDAVFIGETVIVFIVEPLDQT
jgi:hypothetical protein